MASCPVMLLLPTEIVSGVWISNLQCALDKGDWKRVDVGGMVSLLSNDPRAALCKVWGDPLPFEHLYFKIRDDNVQRFDRDFLDDVCTLIDECRSLQKHVVVHCRAGVSRSAACVMYYLVKSGTHRDSAEALEYMQTKRLVDPSAALVLQMQELDELAIE